MSIIIDNQLHIFSSFKIDKSLPKYFKPITQDDSPDDEADSENGSTKFRSSIRSRLSESSRMFWDPMDPDNNGIEVEMEPGLWAKMKAFFFGRSRKKEMSFDEIKKVFTLIVSNMSKVETILKEDGATIDRNYFIESIIKYSESLRIIKENGQIALYDKMVSETQTFIYETILKSSGYANYISEEDLISFLTRHPKRSYHGFRLDWLKNYIRLIPNHIIKAKKCLDQLKIFDNYVVLHYDPNGTNSDLTKKEKEEIKKDPILFGVFQSSRRLYFIGDWVDEVCDLKFSEIMSYFKNNDHKRLEINVDKYNEFLGDVAKTINESVKNEDIQEIIKTWL